MLIAVKDACVLIDLVNGGVIGHWFQLQIETHTTDAVLFEVEAEEQHNEVKRLVEAGLIKVSQMHGEGSFDALENLRTTADEMGVSVPDASVFLLAQRLNALLLTGDGDLRKHAVTKGVMVCGVLWILDMLLWGDVIDFGLATQSLRAMLANGARLPNEECHRRMESWQKQIKIQPRVI